ncbi:hypothetical protein Gotur_027946, partial [Gossypium turneri]
MGIETCLLPISLIALCFSDTQVCVAAVNMDKYRYAGFRWAVSLKQVESYMFVVNLVHCVVCYPMFVCGGGAFGAICWCSITLETRRVVEHFKPEEAETPLMKAAG